MKKVFIIMIVAVFLLSGCGDDKDASATQSNESETVTTPVQQTEQRDESPVSTAPSTEPAMQPTQPVTTPANTASAEQTKEELEELSEALEGLTGGDFSDIDYSE